MTDSTMKFLNVNTSYKFRVKLTAIKQMANIYRQTAHFSFSLTLAVFSANFFQLIFKIIINEKYFQ